MDAVHRHKAAEQALRQLLDDGELAQPDEIEYHPTEILAFWHDSKVVIAIDLDDSPDLSSDAA